MRIPRLSEYVHYENTHDFKSVLTPMALQGFEFSYISRFFHGSWKPIHLLFWKKLWKRSHSIFKQKTRDVVCSRKIKLITGAPLKFYGVFLSLCLVCWLCTVLQLGVKRRYIYRIYKYTHHNINMPPQLPCSLVMFPCAIWKHQIKCQLKTFWACLLSLYFNMMLLVTTMLCPKSVSLL